MKKKDNKKITVGIPAYKSEKYIAQCISSIYTQTLIDDISIVIATDGDKDDYTFLTKQYPTLNITILPYEGNKGPGLARQRCLDACSTEWITFIDADDVFHNPFAIESLYSAIGAAPNAIEVQGAFLQEVEGVPEQRFIINNEPSHPWVFGRLYNATFLKKNGIGFSELRAMEDGELNWKIRLLTENTPNNIVITDNPVYVWRTGSEHSITRSNIDEKGIPQYNFDLCQWGATEASIRAIKFAKKKNPFNGNVLRFTAESMVRHYFTYVQCLELKPVFAEQNLYNSKKFYHECYCDIEKSIDEDVLKELYTIIRMQEGMSMINIMPSITFYEFMDMVKNTPYGGEEEFKEVRSRLPEELVENDRKTGVLGRNE